MSKEQVFAGLLQASLDAGLGSGTSAVEVLGPSPVDVASMRVRATVTLESDFEFDLPVSALDDPEETQRLGAAEVALSLTKELSGPLATLVFNIAAATPEQFLPDEEIEEVTDDDPSEAAPAAGA